MGDRILTHICKIYNGKGGKDGKDGKDDKYNACCYNNYVIYERPYYDENEDVNNGYIICISHEKKTIRLIIYKVINEKKCYCKCNCIHKKKCCLCTSTESHFARLFNKPHISYELELVKDYKVARTHDLNYKYIDYVYPFHWIGKQIRDAILITETIEKGLEFVITFVYKDRYLSIIYDGKNINHIEGIPILHRYGKNKEYILFHRSSPILTHQLSDYILYDIKDNNISFLKNDYFYLKNSIALYEKKYETQIYSAELDNGLGMGPQPITWTIKDKYFQDINLMQLYLVYVLTNRKMARQTREKKSIFLPNELIDYIFYDFTNDYIMLSVVN